MHFQGPIGYIQNQIRMKFKILEIEYNGLIFKIEEDYPEVGVYLYIYKNGKCIKDYLQNDIKTCKEIAFEEYKVPIKNWK